MAKLIQALTHQANEHFVFMEGHHYTIPDDLAERLLAEKPPTIRLVKKDNVPAGSRIRPFTAPDPEDPSNGGAQKLTPETAAIVGGGGMTDDGDGDTVDVVTETGATTKKVPKAPKKEVV